MRIKQTIIILASAILFAACAKSDGVEQFNKTDQGLALKGYDAVAYFTGGKAAQGTGEFSHTWGGATWHFTNAANRDRFAQEPTKYAPQYGGYCSWAVSHGYTADGDPEAWKIVDGKLYLNYNLKVKEKWEENIPEYVRKGDENWPAFLKKKPEHKG